jgi:molecular chaperone GrpE
MIESEKPVNEGEGKNTNQQVDEANGMNDDRVAELEAENRKLRDQALRTIADMENLRRRTQQEQSRMVEYANERLLRELLPIVDDFRRSVDAGEQSHDFDSFFQGIQLVNAKLEKLLDAQGVKRMDVVGKPFDVNLHDAMMHQPSDAAEGTVITELEPGFMYGDKVLRHAKVIVSAGN